MNHAERFSNLAAALNGIRASYRRAVPKGGRETDYPRAVVNEDYLITHLTHMVRSQTNPIAVSSRTNTQHQLLGRANGKDGRRQLPVTIVRALQDKDSEWTQIKFEVKWIVCFLNNILPDQAKENWQLFECSHICIEDDCVTANHLCWESKSVNQSRGQSFCTRVCTHDDCEQIVCVCQRFHLPSCC